jgi:FdhE protein
LRGYIDDGIWLRGYCPVCGGEPLMGKLEQETGKRFLGCCLCRTEWVFKRLECPFCANSNQEELRYFYDEGNPAYRVELCDGCKAYLKTVDRREKAREIPLFVENLATVDLDLVAKGEGFQRETTRLFGL